MLASKFPARTAAMRALAPAGCLLPSVTSLGSTLRLAAAYALAHLLVEPEADHHGHVAVDLQLRPLAELLGVLDRQRVQSQAGGELADDLGGRVSVWCG
jgi:hypothetical protein